VNSKSRPRDPRRRAGLSVARCEAHLSRGSFPAPLWPRAVRTTAAHKRAAKQNNRPDRPSRESVRRQRPTLPTTTLVRRRTVPKSSPARRRTDSSQKLRRIIITLRGSPYTPETSAGRDLRRLLETRLLINSSCFRGELLIINREPDSSSRGLRRQPLCSTLDTLGSNSVRTQRHGRDTHIHTNTITAAAADEEAHEKTSHERVVTHIAGRPSFAVAH
jgi:hypothetical protein